MLRPRKQLGELAGLASRLGRGHGLESEATATRRARVDVAIRRAALSARAWGAPSASFWTDIELTERPELRVRVRTSKADQIAERDDFPAARRGRRRQRR